jgi:hypothetical protein
MTLSSIDPSRSERVLLANVHRWARTNGWRPGPRGWENPERTFAIEPRDGEVVIWWLSTTANGPAPWRTSPLASCRYILADSAVQAIDLLVVYGYLPPLWSSAYALAVGRYSEQIEALEEDLARKDHYLAMGDQTIAGLIEENRELRRAAAVAQLSQAGGR